MHRDHIRGGTLREGDRVALDTIETSKGPAARNVTVDGEEGVVEAPSGNTGGAEDWGDTSGLEDYSDYTPSSRRF